MKIGTTFRGEFRGVSERPYTAKDGSTQKSYKVGVELDNGEMGQLPCGKEFLLSLDKTGTVKGDNVKFFAEYDSDYNRLRVLGVMLE